MYEETLKNEEISLKTENELIFIEKSNNGYHSILDNLHEISNIKDDIDAREFARNNVRSYKGN